MGVRIHLLGIKPTNYGYLYRKKTSYFGAGTGLTTSFVAKWRPAASQVPTSLQYLLSLEDYTENIRVSSFLQRDVNVNSGWLSFQQHHSISRDFAIEEKRRKLFAMRKYACEFSSLVACIRFDFWSPVYDSGRGANRCEYIDIFNAGTASESDPERVNCFCPLRDESTPCDFLAEQKIAMNYSF